MSKKFLHTMNNIFILKRERYEPMVGYYKLHEQNSIYSEGSSYLFYELNGDITRGTLLFEHQLKKLIPFDIETYENIRKDYLIQKYENKLKALKKKKNDN